MIRSRCPNCASDLKIKDALGGKTCKCPACAQPFRVPTRSAPPDDEPLSFADERLFEEIQPSSQVNHISPKGDKPNGLSDEYEDRFGIERIRRKKKRRKKKPGVLGEYLSTSPAGSACFSG